MKQSTSKLVLLAFFRIYSSKELNDIKFILQADRNITVEDDEDFIHILDLFNVHEKRTEEEEKIAKTLQQKGINK